MALRDITQKIISDSNVESERIKKGAEAKSLEIAREKDASIVALKKEFQVKLERELKEQKKRARSQAEQEGRLAEDRARYEMITEVREKANSELSEMSDSEYKEILKTLMKRVPKGSCQSLVLPENREVITKEAAKELGLEVGSFEKGDFESGFVVKTADSEYNFIFSKLINEVLSDKEDKIASMLFPSE